MTEPTLAGFREFVNAQPPACRINHAMWSTCAVGDYLTSIDRCSGQASRHSLSLLGARLHEELGNATGDSMPTYGELQETLKRYDDNGEVVFND